ncbi:MAG: hypothetical protein H7Z37_05305 [Pyrinomonadaceae bacterium]|nr:hypothetical protein [Pyrinomonadaceae bacterium]
MAVEFRSPGIGDIYRMIWRQKLTVALPIIAIALSVGFVVRELPNVFESKALLTITPPQISTSVVRSMSDEDISQRLNAITEEVKSRSSLEPIVTKDNLFQVQRQNGAPMESIIETMKKNIKVEVLSTNDEKQATTFNISYRDNSAESARTVVRELSSKYVNAQQQASFDTSESTREFFDKQLADSKAKLDGIDKQRLDYMLSHADNLPTSSAGLIAQLNDLRNQEKTWSSEKELRFAELGRLRDNRNSIEKQKGIAQDYAEKEAEQNQRLLGDPTRTPAYSQLVGKRGELQGQLDNLLKQYRAQHPEVIAKQDQINAVNKEIENLKQDARRSTDEVREYSQGKAALQVKLLDNEAAKIDGEIARQEMLMKNLEDKIAGLQPQSADLQRRIESVPNSEVALDSFNRTYNMEKTTFDELQKKKNDADIAAKSVLENKGESIRIVDTASLSQVPVAPNRPLLIGMGVGVGLLIGLVLAALFEMPRLLTIQTLDDAKHYTNLPVLASIPEMLTPREKFWRRGTNFMKAIAGVVIAAGSIPLLIIALQVTHIFDRFVR